MIMRINNELVHVRGQILRENYMNSTLNWNTDKKRKKGRQTGHKTKKYRK